MRNNINNKNYNDIQCFNAIYCQKEVIYLNDLQVMGSYIYIAPLQDIYSEVLFLFWHITIMKLNVVVKEYRCTSDEEVITFSVSDKVQKRTNSYTVIMT